MLQIKTWAFVQTGEVEAPAGVNGQVNGINGHSEDLNKDAAPKASLRLGFAEYRRISNLLVLHLRKAEEGKNLVIKKTADSEFREQLLLHLMLLPLGFSLLLRH